MLTPRIPVREAAGRGRAEADVDAARGRRKRRRRAGKTVTVQRPRHRGDTTGERTLEERRGRRRVRPDRQQGRRCLTQAPATRKTRIMILSFSGPDDAQHLTHRMQSSAAPAALSGAALRLVTSSSAVARAAGAQSLPGCPASPGYPSGCTYARSSAVTRSLARTHAGRQGCTPGRENNAHVEAVLAVFVFFPKRLDSSRRILSDRGAPRAGATTTHPRSVLVLCSACGLTALAGPPRPAIVSSLQGMRNAPARTLPAPRGHCIGSEMSQVEVAGTRGEVKLSTCLWRPSAPAAGLPAVVIVHQVAHPVTGSSIRSPP